MALDQEAHGQLGIIMENQIYTDVIEEKDLIIVNEQKQGYLIWNVAWQHRTLIRDHYFGKYVMVLLHTYGSILGTEFLRYNIRRS